MTAYSQYNRVFMLINLFTSRIICVILDYVEIYIIFLDLGRFTMKKIFLLLMGMGLFVIGCEMESDSGNISYPGGLMDKIILHSPE